MFEEQPATEGDLRFHDDNKLLHKLLTEAK
jgi:hypothetical protein